VRSPGSRLRSLALISAGTAAALSLLHWLYFDPLRKAETYTRDLRQCWGRKAALDPRLVFLAIDKSSVQLDSLFPDEVDTSPALRMMKAGFPWSREVYALVTQRLVEAGARVIAFDLLFPAPGPGDDAFGAALAKYRDHVLLGCDFVAEHSGRGVSSRLDLPVETLIKQVRPLDSRLGYVTFWSDPDGAVRRARMTTSLQELDGTDQPSDERFESLEARTLRCLGRSDLILSSGERPFRFCGGPRTIIPQSIYEIFVPELWKRNFQSGAFFKDKIVFVGPEGGWSHDEHTTPFRIIDGDQALMPGPELHLNAMNAALQSDYLSEPTTGGEALSFFLAGILGALLSRPRGLLWRTAVTLLALAVYIEICLVVYNRTGLLLLMVVPCGILLATVLINVMADYRTERKEKSELRSTLSHYVGENVVEEILENPAAFLHSLSGVRKTVTVMFTDLRNFTALTASRPPAKMVAQLNEYFSAMTDAVLAENGTVDKLMGDGLMAVWGNLRSEGPQADAHAAMRSALAMRAALDQLNKKWQSRGWPTLRFGVGLAHGEATIGNIGSERKMDFTAIGDVINTASRIERLTVEVGCDLLLSAPLAALAGDAFQLAPGGSIKVKGIEEPLPVFILVDMKQAGPASRTEAVAATAGVNKRSRGNGLLATGLKRPL
jgi:adenylate cyclase